MNSQKKIHNVLLIAGIIFLFGRCKSDTQRGATEAELPDSSSQETYNAATDTNLTPEIGVMMWNEAMNEKNFKRLERMYADEVQLYGKHLSRSDVLALKIEFLRQNPTYTQFLSDIEVEDFTPTAIKAKFTKQSVISQTAKNFYSYLIMERSKTGWKILAEGDSASTNIVTSKENTDIRKKEIKNCETAAEAIFLSSDLVQKLLNEKFVRYKLEYKPGVKNNPNNRYWFWVFAAPPNADMTQTYGRFQVDPKDGQLYEYKAVEDEAIPINYNKDLKKHISKYCGS